MAPKEPLRPSISPVAARGQEPNKEVSALWDQVLRQLASFYSIRANVRMNIALGGEEFIAQGEYIEKIYAPQPNELTKSKERALTEYILVGSLLSFTLAIATGVLLQILI